MTTPFHTASRATIALVLLLLLAAILRIYLVTLDMNILLDQGLVQDDAFYYYVIAKHLLASGTPTFDGVIPTNGFHPVWQAICLPVYFFWHGDVAVRAMLAIAAALDLVSLLLCYRILRRLALDEYIALTGVAVLALHGTIIRTWFNGLETALSLCTLLWLLNHFLAIYRAECSLRKHAAFGAIAALVFLSRTDTAIILVVLYGFLYLPAMVKKQIVPGITATGVLLALVAPWLLWNYFSFGNIVQVSGQLTGDVWLTGGAPPERSWLQALWYGISTSYAPVGIVFKKMFTPNARGIAPGYLYLGILVLVVVFFRMKSARFRFAFQQLLPFLVGVSVLFLYHAGVRHFVRGWYNAPVLLSIVLLLCLVMDALREKIALDFFAPATPILATLVMLALYSPYEYTKMPENLQTDPRIVISRWINSNTPSDTIIGAANAGIEGYYMERRVINLDGVVNADALRARLGDQLHRYIHDTGIQYLVDHKGSIAHFCRDNNYYRCSAIMQAGETEVVQVTGRQDR